jgi:AcrR family transcriptional regulator
MTDRKTQSLASVLDLARDAFATQRFEDVHLSDIAKAAKCSLNTIYDAFDDKTGLFMAAMASNIETRTQFKHLEQDGPALRRLALATEAHIHFMSLKETRATFRNLIGLDEAVVGGVRGAMRARLAALTQRFADLIKAAQAEGAVKPGPIEPMTEHVLTASHWRPLWLAMLFGDDEPVGMSAADIVAQSLSALLTESGAKALAGLLDERRRVQLAA